MKLSSIAIASFLLAGCAATAEPIEPADPAPDAAPVTADGAVAATPDASAPRDPCDTCAGDADCAPWPGLRCVPQTDGRRACGDPNQPPACPARAPDLSGCWNPAGSPAGCTVAGCEATNPAAVGRAYCLNTELCCAH